MKRYLVFTLIMAWLVSMCSSSAALALGYFDRGKNEATFETLAEARVSAVPWAKVQVSNENMVWGTHAVLDGYPDGTTFLYRSPDVYRGRCSVKLNTCILVFAEESFATKDAAFAYLESLGLIELINEAVGYVFLVTPSDPSKGFTQADQKYYYALQTSIFSLDHRMVVNGVTINFAEYDYYGAYNYVYAVGIGGGATFLNNYVSGTLDYVSRLCGMLLIDGTMDPVRDVAGMVPAYFVNAPQYVVDKYAAVNGVDSITIEGSKTTYYNQQFPVRQVATLKAENPDIPSIIRDAHYSMWLKSARSSIYTLGTVTASTPYQGAGPEDGTPFELLSRNALINGVTLDGIHEIVCMEDTFSDVKNESGEYLDVWVEYLPEEVLNNTAPKGSVPMILVMHGGGQSPKIYVDNEGWLEVAGQERIALICPDHYSLSSRSRPDVLNVVTPQFIDYILAKYPAIDASRVYVTGYSMGGGATFRALYGAPEKFAAAVPMAAVGYTPTAEQIAKIEAVGLPVMLTTSEKDLTFAFDTNAGHIATAYQNHINNFANYNDIDTVAYDFDTYKYAGFPGDIYNRFLLNGSVVNHQWFLTDDAGVPLVGLNFTERMVHADYQPYSWVVWNFMKSFSRDLTTGAIIYTP